MNIAFWDNQLCERGTTTCLYDYAYYNEKILNNRSFIFYDRNNKENNIDTINKFKKYFKVHDTNYFKEVNKYILRYHITHIYIIKSGEIDDRITTLAKNCIHCVFNCDYPHGDIYASINPINNNIPIVPRMINLPYHRNNLRLQLNIPVNSKVFGYYGNKDSFNIAFVHYTVYSIAKHNPNIYFLFANINIFCPILPNIIHLPTIVNVHYKVSFINTCNAMLCARKDNETFGISIGEFSTFNKPIITTKIGNMKHVNILGNNAFYYSNQYELTNILLEFNPEIESKKDWNMYKEYTPRKVINIFKNIFLN
jgi:hypothetical protein